MVNANWEEGIETLIKNTEDTLLMKRERHTDRHIDSHTERHTDRHIDSHTERHTDRHIDNQVSRYVLNSKEIILGLGLVGFMSAYFK